MWRIPFCIAFLAAAPLQAADGKASFLKHCSLCHQADGQGIPGTFPRLIGRVGEIGATSEGAALLAEVMLWGMSGTITVDDVPVTGAMPGVAHLGDEELASIIAYLATEDGSVADKTTFSLETLKTVRAAGRMTPAEVNARRQALFEAGVIP
jgi:mono/diheme cytochrome c family protein